MFARRSHQTESFSKNRARKATSKSKRSFRENHTSSTKAEKLKAVDTSPIPNNHLSSPIVTLVVGPDARLFACHESVLSSSPFFAAICKGQFLESNTKRVNLPEEIPEVFSSVLEYLYKGDYYPRLLHNKRKNSWELEESNDDSTEPTVFVDSCQQVVLKDTVIYCTAERYGLDELKRLALRKQGLRSGVQCSTILSSARFAYSYTPDSDSKLRAHYLALIIRSRNTFKRSGTMEMEMEAGGKLKIDPLFANMSHSFFDLFVALVNHMDDIASLAKTG